MSQYGVLLNGFWDGNTGRDIARVGGAPAQLAAVYLMQNPDANMLGLYFMRLPVMRERIHTLSAKTIQQALAVLAQVEFAEYDLATEHVWVREMAKFRFQLHKKPLKADDNRVIGARNLYKNLRDNPFLSPFFKKYREELHLDKPRRFEGTANILRRVLEGPSKPITESISTNSEQNITGEEKALRADRAPTRELLTFFDELHQKRTGHRAVIRAGKDAALLKGLCRSHEPETIRSLISDFFASKDAFIQDAGFTVGVFVSQAGKLLSRRSRASKHAMPQRTGWIVECEQLHQNACRNAHEHHERMQHNAEVSV